MILVDTISKLNRLITQVEADFFYEFLGEISKKGVLFKGITFSKESHFNLLNNLRYSDYLMFYNCKFTSGSDIELCLSSAHLSMRCCRIKDIGVTIKSPHNEYITPSVCLYKVTVDKNLKFDDVEGEVRVIKTKVSGEVILEYLDEDLNPNITFHKCKFKSFFTDHSKSPLLKFIDTNIEFSKLGMKDMTSIFEGITPGGSFHKTFLNPRKKNCVIMDLTIRNSSLEGINFKGVWLSGGTMRIYNTCMKNVDFRDVKFYNNHNGLFRISMMDCADVDKIKLPPNLPISMTKVGNHTIDVIDFTNVSKGVKPECL